MMRNEEILAAIRASLEGRAVKNALIIPPDFTRFHSNAGLIAGEYYRLLTGRGAQVVEADLVRALREDVTPRQREVLLLYYAEQLNTRQIGEKLGVDKSTVARTIKRGEARLRRCLRYGAEAFLNAAAEGPP